MIDRRKAGKRVYVILVDPLGVWWDRYENGFCVQGFQPRKEAT